MRRRQFITLLGGAAAAWPLAARAQQPAMPVVGFLAGGSPDTDAIRVRAFRQGLSEIGHVEGTNVAIEYRWAEGQYDRCPALAADLVRRQVSVIVAIDTSPALAAKAATKLIPIVFRVGSDPVVVGLVASLNRPGSNLTGVTNLALEVGPKRLELLHEVVPTATVMALLVNPISPFAEALSRDAQAAARSLGLQLHFLHASAEHDIDPVFATLVQLRAHGLVIGTDAFFNTRIGQLGALALQHAVPTVYQFRDFAAAGGLMSYGPSFSDGYRQSASTPAAFSTARSRLIFRCNSPQKSSWSSTSRPPRRSASMSRNPARARRRGDRMMKLFVAAAHDRLWHF